MILADRIVRHGLDAPPSGDQIDFQSVTEADHDLRRALASRDPRSIVERFVFEDDMMEAYEGWVEKYKSNHDWRRGLHSPARAVWLEWKTNLNDAEKSHIMNDEELKAHNVDCITGVYISTVFNIEDPSEYAFYIHHVSSVEVSGSLVNDRQIRSGLVLVFQWGKPPEIIWSDIYPPDLQATIRLVYGTVLYCIFLLTQPRAYEIRHVVPPAKLVKARLKDRKPAPFEYRIIRFHPGAIQTRYARTSGAPTGEHRRFHSVIGHWRHYDDGALVWIPYHWRGDRSKGVVIHERHVDK